MKFGLRLILASFAALGAGALFLSDSFAEPLEGLEPQPTWKGILLVVLGVTLLGFGLKYIVDDQRDRATAKREPND